MIRILIDHDFVAVPVPSIAKISIAANRPITLFRRNSSAAYGRCRNLMDKLFKMVGFTAA
jgi:hypothetical protein